MIIRLQHQRSDGENDIYHLKSGHRYHLGRGSACEVRILDLKLSRKHCAIEYSEGEWRVIDLASTNGCKVDGDQIVGSVALQTGTQIEIGQSTLKVIRILGDEEAEDDEAAAPPTATPELGLAGLVDSATAAPTHDPTARSKAAAAAPAASDLRKPQPMKTPAPLEQLALDDEGERLPSMEHSATDWEPEPVPEEVSTGSALVPNANDAIGLAADKALAAAREAAQGIARQAQGHTGEIQRPGSLGRPGSKILPRPAELESGGYSTLELPESPEPSAVSPKSERITPPAPKAPETKAPDKHPGTETRRRQSVMPVIVQPMSDAEVDAAALSGATVPTFLAMKPTPPPAASIPTPPPPPPPRIVPTGTPASPPPTRTPVVAPAPAAAAPAPAAYVPAPAPAAPAPSATLPSPFLQSTPAPLVTAVPAAPPPGAADAPKSDADRTFFITVLGRRIGPLTRQAARDLKSRELRGTLTFKDLDQFT